MNDSFTLKKPSDVESGVGCKRVWMGGSTCRLSVVLLRTSKAFQWRQNRFEILQHVKNSGERFHLSSSYTIPCEQRLHFRDTSWRAKSSSYRENVASARRVLIPRWGVWFCVYVRGLSGSLKIWQGNCWFCMRLHFFIKASFIIDTKGLYCVTKGNISFSSLLFCFRSAAFLLWVLLLIAIFISKLCGQPMSINRFLKSEILPQRSLFLGFSRLLVCQLHFNNW